MRKTERERSLNRANVHGEGGERGRALNLTRGEANKHPTVAAAAAAAETAAAAYPFLVVAVLADRLDMGRRTGGGRGGRGKGGGKRGGGGGGGKVQCCEKR